MILFWMACSFISGFVYCCIGWCSVDWLGPFTESKYTWNCIFFWPYWWGRFIYQEICNSALHRQSLKK